MIGSCDNTRQQIRRVCDSSLRETDQSVHQAVEAYAHASIGPSVADFATIR